MAGKAGQRKFSIWNFFDDIKCDKVVLIIVVSLVMMSILTIFSSTSLLVTSKTSRIDMFLEQLLVVAGGVFLMWGLAKIQNIKIFRILSQSGFIISFVLLLLLDCHVNLAPLVKAEYLNQAWRTLRIFGFQLHVFEVVKVAMVMYLAWAVQAWQNDEFVIVDRLAHAFPLLKFLKSNLAKELIYVFIPMGVVCLMIMGGSNSSMIFIALVMVITIIIGGFDIKNTLICCLLAAVVLMGLLLFKPSGSSDSGRSSTFKSRIENFFSSYEDQLAKMRKGLEEGTVTMKQYNDFIDANRQVQGAKIAIHEGRTPKGPGGSTQKYTVAVIFGDFMYSFIIEEYGIFGGIFILILFGSLLARGSLIAKNLESTFARTAVGGLTALISGQALMHILVNVQLMPMTGQTLPLISDGKSAFLMFSIAFGILLSFSKMARKNIEVLEEAAKPIIPEEPTGDEVMDGLNDLDRMDFDEIDDREDNIKDKLV